MRSLRMSLGSAMGLVCANHVRNRLVKRLLSLDKKFNNKRFTAHVARIEPFTATTLNRFNVPDKDVVTANSDKTVKLEPVRVIKALLFEEL